MTPFEALEQRVAYLENLLVGTRAEERIDYVDIAQLVLFASFHTGAAATDIYGPARDKAACRARMAVVWVARAALRLSFPRIGTRLKRDHSSIQNAFRRAEHFRDHDPAFRMLTDRMLRHFQAKEEKPECQH